MTFGQVFQKGFFSKTLGQPENHIPAQECEQICRLCQDLWHGRKNETSCADLIPTNANLISSSEAPKRQNGRNSHIADSAVVGECAKTLSGSALFFPGRVNQGNFEKEALFPMLRITLLARQGSPDKAARSVQKAAEGFRHPG
jgi:hypothetical protein